MDRHNTMNDGESKLGTTPDIDWSKLTPDEKKHLLFEKQKQMLDGAVLKNLLEQCV